LRHHFPFHPKLERARSAANTFEAVAKETRGKAEKKRLAGFDAPTDPSDRESG
jgi:hypothetical protein